MPRGAPSDYARAVRGSVFSALAHRISTFAGEIYPLHVGDTWMEPPEGCRMEDLRVADHPGLHRYAPPSGLPALIEALIEHTRARTGVAVERANVQVAAGATAALASVMGAILDPGDQVIILAPYWPLIEGIVRSLRGTPVAAPFHGDVIDAATAVEAVERHRTERTVALYFGFPNNPTGRVVPPEWLEALVDWAARHDLWVISDEVYEDYVYRGSWRSCLSLLPERTFTAHSFSKAYGMAGNRCGWVVGPAAVMPEVAKVATHLFYSTPTAAQLAALRILEGGGAVWLERAQQLYRSLGERSAELLGVAAPDGGTFLFLDVNERLNERGLLGFLEDCAERGVFLAPGPSFGPFPEHARICFTAAPPEVTLRGVALLRDLLGRSGAASS